MMLSFEESIIVQGTEVVRDAFSSEIHMKILKNFV